MKLFLIIVLNLLVNSFAQKNHSIAKRSLLFPRATVLQFTYGISAPLILPRRSINLSMCLQVNYDLPYNITNFRPKIIQAKASGDFDLNREMFYKYIIRFLNSFGLNGEQCLYRLICEISEYPMHLEHAENLLEKIVHFVFTPSLEEPVNNSSENFSGRLLQAENLGRDSGQCDKTYSKCFISLSEEHSSILPPIPQDPIRSEPQQQSDSREIYLDGVKARVDKIHVDGLARTKDDIIEDCIRDLFKATDFQDVLLKAHRARLKLDELGCFKSIAVFIDTSKGTGASPDGLEVTFNVTEFKRITGGVTTQVGNNEGALLIGMKAPNLFGRGERVQVEYSHGSKRTTNFNLAFVKPMRGKYRPIFTTSVFQSNSEWPVSGYKELDRGLLLDFGFHSTPLIKHNLQWEATIRDLAVLSRNTSFEVREQAGLSLKSSLKHIISIDLRDDVIFPTLGSLLQLTSEAAGLGGDVGFLKNEFFVQGNYSITEDFVLQGTLSGGYMRGLSNDMKIGMSDTYYLGGPLSLRGFQMRGVGPHSEGDALGSLAYWASGLHLFTPLPFRPGRGGFGDLFKTHLFITAGNVGDFRLSEHNLLEALAANVRISYGLGLALRLGNMARVEVNYCFPYMYEKGDQVHPGIQFGIGVQFV